MEFCVPDTSDEINRHHLGANGGLPTKKRSDCFADQTKSEESSYLDLKRRHQNKSLRHQLCRNVLKSYTTKNRCKICKVKNSKSGQMTG